METHPPTGTVTFLYTDIESSADLAQRYPDAMPRLLNQHNEILRQAIEGQRGTIFRTAGDAICAAFSTADEALQAALLAQRGLQQVDWQPAPVLVRMGIHTGQAQIASGEAASDGYSDYLTLTRAQRVMSVAHGGQVLVSAPAAELLRGELPTEVELHDLGEHRLKGLLNPERLWQAIAPGLRAEFPPLASLNGIPNNLPVQLSSFVGRQREIHQAVEMLKNARLLTLTGVGGSGKTRLSLQAAAEMLDAFPDGVWFIELAPLAEATLLWQSVAAALGVQELPGRTLQTMVVDYLREKQILLLFDNCEHLIEACASIAQHLLSTCPQLHILASSREALGISGESIMPVPSLSLPEIGEGMPAADISAAESVQLFQDRASAVDPGFEVGDVNAAAVAQICKRLDGIPLAIELAAARVKMFSPEQILARLDDRFRLLTGGSRTAVPRQQTLRATIDWSYVTLPDDERTLFRRLAVFAGGWTFEAAEVIVDLGDGLSLYLVDLLQHLIDKSLVLVEAGKDGTERRYRYLETIRQYAGEKLLDSGEAISLRNCHLRYFRELAEQAGQKFHSPAQFAWLERMRAEDDNLRLALAWGMENDPESALQLVNITEYWSIRGQPAEGRSWITKILKRVEELPQIEGQDTFERKAAIAKGQLTLGVLAMGQGDNTVALKAFQESIRLARIVDEKPILAEALGMTGVVEALSGNLESSLAAIKESEACARASGDALSLARALAGLSAHASARRDLAAARRYTQEAYDLYQKFGDPWSSALAIMFLGRVIAQQTDYTQAQLYYQDALETFRKVGDRFRGNMVRSELAHLARRQGKMEQARKLYHETLQLWQELGHQPAVAHQLECCAIVAEALGDWRKAARLFGAAEVLRQELNALMNNWEQEEYQAAVDHLRSLAEPGELAEAWSQGRRMRTEAAVAYALEE